MVSSYWFACNGCRPWNYLLGWPLPPWTDRLLFILGIAAAFVALLGDLFVNWFDKPVVSAVRGRKGFTLDVHRPTEPIVKVTYAELVERLGRGGAIEWMDRSSTNVSLLATQGHLAIVGLMKSGRISAGIDIAV